jgi:hypothetical protein
MPRRRAEARGQRADARRHYTPAMAPRIDIAKLYREALHRLPESMDGLAPMPVPRDCPVTLEEMLAEPEG